MPDCVLVFHVPITLLALAVTESAERSTFLDRTVEA
jgi:hypothetical protein